MITPEEKQRIEQAAEVYADRVLHGHKSAAFSGYLSGARSEHQIAWNKAIDEVQKLFKDYLLPIDPLAKNILEIAKAVSEIYKELEALKHKQS